MKLTSFSRGGQRSFGVVAGSGIVDLGARMGAGTPDLKTLLAGDFAGKVQPLATEGNVDFPLDSVELEPVIPNPGKIWCCGLNYGEHVRETKQQVSEKPVFFLRVADSQVGHGRPLLRPTESTHLDYEAEIAIVIGKPGRRISEADAWSHIAGYACYNDGSVRDWQRHSSQWCPGKNFYRTGGFGPWMVTSDEIPADTTMSLTCRLNGQVMQHATTDMMLHSIPRQIAYVSAIAPLQTGDVIVTGTPGGVGARREPPVWMKAGDVVEIEVDRIGILRNPIADDR